MTTSSLSRQTSPSLRAPAWLVLGALLGAVLGGSAAVLGPLSWLALLGVAAIAVALLAPSAAIPLVIVASAVNRYEVVWGPARVRYDIIAVLLIAGVLAACVAVRTLRLRDLYTPLALPLLAYVGINVVSTVLFAVERTRGISLDAELCAIFLAYVSLIFLLRTRADLERALRWLWWITVIEAAIGVLAVALFAAHVTDIGVQVDKSNFPMAYGTQWEGNIFGSFLLGNFFLLLADFTRSRRSRLQLTGLVVVVLGIAVSMTRTVWLALVLGLVIYLALSVAIRRAKSSIWLLLSLLPMIAMLGLLVGTVTPFGSRLLQVVDLQTSSASGRIVMYQVAIQEWRVHPLLGAGTGSFNFGAAPGLPHPWLANIFLLALHDTGIVGFGILLWLLWRLYRPLLRTVRTGGDMAALAAGTIAGFTALLLAFQATTGFWFMYTWIVAAIGFAATQFNRQTSE
ncbi:MAG TPA: O-antigen ligase family protein [Chloroflexota bacterium]|nr:O-antigen ligase family protein [Chloroflexota bacterium]